MIESTVAGQEAENTAARLPLLSGTALMFAVRLVEYLALGAAGVILARGLGAEGRGLFSLITGLAAMAYAPVGLGVVSAGVYLAGQRRFDQQTLFSNSLAWGLCVGAVYAVATAILLTLQDSAFGLTRGEIAIAVAVGGIGMIGEAAMEFLLARGQMPAYTLVRLVTPLIWLLCLLAVLGLGGLEVGIVAAAWLAVSVVITVIPCLLIGRKLKLSPRVNVKALRQQISFGARGHAGWLLQVLNHRLDIFIVAYFAGAAAVGQYTIGFNMAELTWWVPVALGVVLFPKASTLDPEANSQLSAAVCRRAMLVTLLVTLGLLAVGGPLIILLYGRAFEASLTPFYVLLPSGILYTVHRVLSTSLSAQGMPQASLYGGAVSVPLMIGLDIALISRWGITGAAIASDVAYAVNAAVLLVLFVRVTHLPWSQVLLFNRSDLEAFQSVLQGVSRRRGPEVKPELP